MKKKWILSALMFCSLLSLASCGNNESPKSNVVTNEKTVTKLTMKTLPTKVEYLVGEEFSLDGGVVTVTYADKTTEDIPLSDKRLSVDAPDLSTEGKKNVVVKLGSKRVTFSIQVKQEVFTITFDLNFDGGEDFTKEVKKNEKLVKPEDPVRENYSFDGWYKDEGYTSAYDFTSIVTESFTLYAKWLDNSKTTYTFTFNYNYFGNKNVDPSQSITVEEGATVNKIKDPTFKGYDFIKWSTAANGGEEYNFSKPVTANTTIYAQWKRNSEFTGEQTYTFEAEDTSLKGKTGPGLSGTASEKAMIIKQEGLNASNDRFVGYLYKMGLSLEFYFTSDKAISNATLVLSLGQEREDYTYNPENYGIKLNGTDLNFADVAFKNVPTAENTYSKFSTFTIATNLFLVKGRNLLQLTTKNSDPVQGTTITAHAPLVDCAKITVTDTVLDWDSVKGLPAKNY